MDENLMNSTLRDATEDIEVKEIDVPVEDIKDDVSVEETIYDIVVEPEEDIVIDISESMGWVSGDDRYHDSLLGIDFPRQHPIEAITNLREELNEIERLKTVHSDQFNIANYYEWADASYDEYGYFVSLVPNTSRIKICNNESSILGVSVSNAGFVGGQNASIPRGNSYGLIATSGLVDVRCESGVNVGDCVISNAHGWATKTDSPYGYKVLATEEKEGVKYAVILLGVQADVTNAIGVHLSGIKDKVDANEKNIVSAVNVANAAYNQVSDCNSVSEEAVRQALEAIKMANKASGDVAEMDKVFVSVKADAEQAKAIAESAVTSSLTIKDDAVKRANDAWAKAESVEKETYSLCAKLDTYSVGEYSQAHGLTYEQAKGILEIGIIYVPTKHIDSEIHSEQYSYGDNKTYKREFTPGFLYRWDYISNGDIDIGWVTVGESKSVWFTPKEPTPSDAYQYWYADGAEIEDKNGNVGIYESYTLYKWDTDHWIAVATLKGNVNNRAISMISQTANSVSAEVTNARGDFASLDARINDEVSQVSMVATKLLDNGEINAAAIVASVNESESSVAINANKIVLSGDTFFVDKDGNATTIDGSHITAGTVTANYIDSVSGNIGGFKIGEKSIYNVFNYTNDLSYFMTEPDELNSSDAYAGGYVVGDTHGYVYIGTDGIGLMNVEHGSSANEIVAQTYMSDGKLFSNSADISGKITATSGYIGYAGSGLAIESNALKNVLSHGDKQYYMTNPTKLNSTDIYAGGIADGNHRDYVYVGTDGIGTLRTKYASDTNKITAQTYIQNGELHTNAGIIGDENSDYKWTISYNDTSAYLYCKDSAVASMGGIPAPASSGVYLGTDGLSYTLGYDSKLDYTTVVKAGQILTYGTFDGSGLYNRATHMRFDGIGFFYAGNNTVSGISNLSDFKVGGIEIGTDESLNISAKKLVFYDASTTSSNSIELTHTSSLSTVKTANSMMLNVSKNLTIRSDMAIYISTTSGLYSSGYKTKSGWMKVRCVIEGGNTYTDRYLHFMNGMLVDIREVSPTGTITWLV